MRLTQLQYLLEIKKCGSISKAAQRLFIAQPSMSAAIKDLENELGYELIKRSKKGVTFTFLGEQVIEKATTIMQEMEEIRCLNQVQTGHMSGRVFLSATPFACEHFVLDLIIHLNEQHPDLNLLLDENDGSTVLQQVNRQEADLGVIMIYSNEDERYQKELEKNKLIFKELYRDDVLFLVGKQNPYYGQKSVSIKDILQYPYVYYKDSYTEEDAALFTKHIPSEQFKTVRIKDRESVKKYVAHSQATTIMPSSLSEGNVYLQTGLLWPLQLTDETWSCRIGVVYRNDTALTREELFLIEQLHNITKKTNNF